MSASLARAKRALLAMLGGSPPEADADWPTVAAMAAAHRLEPLLAWRMEGPGWAVPADIAGRWRAAHRAAAISALAQAAALRLAAERLDAAGIDFVALKGPRLAWCDYPAPALRPMRDLDLLVPEREALPAAGVLGEAGFAMADADAASIAEALREDKHLPPLWHDRLGAAVELHHRLTDLPARRGYRVPQLDPVAMIARSETLELGGARVRCPAPADLLAHLMVHALYGHRLDCGPLVLADIHFLLAAETIDWPAFRGAARAGGWERGAALMLALTARYFGPQPGGWPAPPEPILAAAENALLADPATRDHAETLADLLAARGPAAFARALRRRATPDAQVVAGEGGGRPGWRFWPLWAARRLARLVSRLSNRRAMSEARGAARVIRWLKP
ncbi:MAG TPA: nucleotidyltransferase family protein [Novosphingobium sp.]|nr:nucleotidyltransferase family protein [Novosphingobium sp.]